MSVPKNYVFWHRHLDTSAEETKITAVVCTRDCVITGGFSPDCIVWKSSCSVPTADTTTREDHHLIKVENPKHNWVPEGSSAQVDAGTAEISLVPTGRLDVKAGVLAMKLSHSEQYVAVSTRSYDLLVFDLWQEPQYERLKVERLPKYCLSVKCFGTSVANVWHVAWSPNDNYLASGGIRCSLCVWEVQSNTNQRLPCSNEFKWLWKDDTTELPPNQEDSMMQAMQALGQTKEYLLGRPIPHMSCDLMGPLGYKHAGVLCALDWDHDSKHVFIGTSNGGIAYVRLGSNMDTKSEVVITANASGGTRIGIRVACIAVLAGANRSTDPRAPARWAAVGLADGDVFVVSPQADSNEKLNCMTSTPPIALGSAVTCVCALPRGSENTARFAVTTKGGLLSVLSITHQGKYSRLFHSTPGGRGSDPLLCVACSHDHTYFGAVSSPEAPSTLSMRGEKTPGQATTKVVYLFRNTEAVIQERPKAAPEQVELVVEPEVEVNLSETALEPDEAMMLQEEHVEESEVIPPPEKKQKIRKGDEEDILEDLFGDDEEA
eukprot:Platyproteum_vivax@DN1392_c0_g1_i1.p1